MNLNGKPGRTMLVTASGAVASSDALVVGNTLAIAVTDIADTEQGEAAIEGAFYLPKKTGAGEAIDQGSNPVWDASPGQVAKEGTALATGDVSGALTALAAAGDNDTTVLVKINTGHGTVGV